MSSKKSQILNLWENSYKQNVENRFLTNFEALSMISNETGLDIENIKRILKSSFMFIEKIHSQNHPKRHYQH